MSAVASDNDRWLCESAAGLESDFEDVSKLDDDGNADDMEAVEKVELLGDRIPGSLLLLSFSSTVALFELEDRVQDAKAARCSGKQPCRVSLSLQASGFKSIRKRMKRQTSINGSSSVSVTVLPPAVRSYIR